MTTGLEELGAFARWLEQHFAPYEQEWARMAAARATGQVPVPDPWWTDQDCAYVALRAQIDAIRRIKTQVTLRLLVLQSEADVVVLEEEAAKERAEDYRRWLSSGARPRRGTSDPKEEDGNESAEQ